MESTQDIVAQKGPHSLNRRLNGGISASEVFGFPVSSNQFNVLQTVQPAESQSQPQREEGLVNPRSTRLLRLAAQRAKDQGTLADGECRVDAFTKWIRCTSCEFPLR